MLLAAAGRAAEGPLLVAIGDVTPTTAVLWARGVRPGVVDFALTTATGGGPRGEIVVASDRDLTGQTLLGGLQPATRYGYRASQGEAVVEGVFVTAPPAEAAAGVRFLWSGDLGGAGFCRLREGGYRIMPAMQRRAADFFLFVGDTVYADVPCDRPGVIPGAAFTARTLPQYRARHRYNREDPGLQALLRGTSVYAIWDDHEVSNDFDSRHPLMSVGRQAFLEYWPIVTPPAEPGRLYRRFRWGALLDLFVLDTRQYRSPNALPDGPDKTMLGDAQHEWVVAGVAASSATWKVIVSSVSLSIPTGRRERRDSWTGASVFGHPQPGAGFVTARARLLDALRGVKNVVFVVADVHHAEVIRHEPHPGWAIHELVAGPLSAGLGRPRPLDASLNPTSLFARGGVYSFGEVAIDGDGLRVQLMDEAGSVMFSHAVRAR